MIKNMKVCIDQYNNLYSELQKSFLKLNELLITFNVIERNPHGNIIFESICSQNYKKKSKPLFFLFPVRVILYFIKSYAWFIWFIKNKIFFIILFDKKKSNDVYQSNIIMNHHFVSDILKNDDLIDKSFDKILTHSNENLLCYHYPNIIWDIGYTFNIKKLINIFKKSNKNIITDYNFISGIDIIKLFYFLNLAPLLIIRMLWNVRNLSNSIVVSDAIIHSLNPSILMNYIRFINGKKLGKKINLASRIFSWYENQILEKCFFFGVNHNLKRSIKTFGCQPFVFPLTQVNIIPTQTEIDCKLTPDILLSSGEIYREIYKNELENIIIGKIPSTRTDYVFNPIRNPTERNLIYILFSYYEVFSREILTLTKEIFSGNNHSILYKFHPDWSNQERLIFQEEIPSNWRVFDNSIEECLQSASLIITTESGTSVEAVAMGVSVIIIGSNSYYTSNPLDSTGKGVIWDIAYNSKDFNTAYNNLLSNRVYKVEELNSISNYYLNNYFTPYSKELVYENLLN